MKNFKRVLTVSMATLLIFSLCGCNSATKETQVEETTSVIESDLDTKPSSAIESSVSEETNKPSATSEETSSKPSATSDESEIIRKVSNLITVMNYVDSETAYSYSFVSNRDGYSFGYYIIKNDTEEYGTRELTEAEYTEIANYLEDIVANWKTEAKGDFTCEIYVDGKTTYYGNWSQISAFMENLQLPETAVVDE